MATTIDSAAKITASRAKGEFGLNDNDLSELDCILVRNPHYRSAACMRLYVLSDVEAASDAKKASAAAREAGREDVRAEKLLKAKASAKAAAALVASLCLPTPASTEGSTVLPVEIWFDILSKVVEFETLREEFACHIARDVINAGMVCRDMRIASVDVLSSLNDKVKSVKIDDSVVKAVSDPGRMKKAELKQVLSGIGLAVGGNKPELIVRILDSLGLKVLCKSDAPVALMLEARRQRVTPWRSEPGLSSMHHIDLKPRLKDTAFRVYKTLYEKYRGDIVMIGRILRVECLKCGNGLRNSKWCSKGMCVKCCSDPQCIFHESFKTNCITNNNLSFC